MPTPTYPVTPAIRVLRRAKVQFEALLFRYVEKGGTAHSSATLGWDEHRVIKTLVVQGPERQHFAVLMHGDKELSLRGLARQLELKQMHMADPGVVTKLTGYQVGGVSPFGMRQDLPILAQHSIQNLDRIAINGGKRGFLVSITPEDLTRVLEPRWVDAAADSG